ncbi:hypothetical protein GCM10009554_46380 [Kribbella koreensis]|uniref:TetR family transcriptional regulator n=1 Tax=Kribbella koreensis TaxID=57909 RepID=A0ABP4BFI1_9ACTN
MTHPNTTERQTRIDSIDMDLVVALDYPHDTLDEAIETGDDQLVAVVQCTEAVVFYAEELHLPHRLQQFLSPAESGQVAAYIESLGPNPARAEQWMEPRYGYVTRGERRADAGWNADLARAALQTADERAAEGGLSENVTDCIEILRAFLGYLDRLHAPAGFTEVLTPSERTKVGAFLTDILRG